MVNSRQIAKHALASGDTIAIGRNTLQYKTDAPGDAEDMDKTMILRPGQFGAAFKPTPPEGEPAAPKAEPAKPVSGKLRVASGANTGKELELTKALTTIGKPGVQVAAITRRADGYYIVHVGGAEGGARPVVNGMEIDAQARKLNHGDTIELVGTKMTFLLS